MTQLPDEEAQKLLFEFKGGAFTLDGDGRKIPLVTADKAKVLEVWKILYPGVDPPASLTNPNPTPNLQPNQDPSGQPPTGDPPKGQNPTQPDASKTNSADPPVIKPVQNNPPTDQTPAKTTQTTPQSKSSGSESKASTDNSSTKSSKESSQSSIFNSMGSGSMSQKPASITTAQRDAIDASLQRVNNNLDAVTRKTVIAYMETVKNDWEPKITATDQKTQETQYDEISKTYIDEAAAATNRKMYIGLGVVGGLVLIGAGYYYWRSKNVRDAPTTVP